MLSAGVLLAGLASLAVAQFPPKPEGVTVLRSKFHENVTISFKEVCGPFIVPQLHWPLVLLITDVNKSAGDLRNHSRSQIVCWPRPSSSAAP